ncbi:hypothetical protein B0H17DRAFT_1204436 [Mycena rosella]|uniref:DUF1857-domain-containing protein n=1 Tax=Mycena rosella TaxID=1033263 RepID=A0AAD7D9A7_MYCRO|nr:hypothetical protein B0H17DRAFT_1204436 [Mycena rosella]
MSAEFAVTRSVNPRGAEPAIAEEQLWKGFHYKARNPAVFIPIISLTKVDEGDKIVGEVRFGHSPDVVSETFEAHAATIMYCEMDTGKRVTNLVPTTILPGVATDQPKPSAKELNGNIEKTLDDAIALVRRMVKEGKL